MLATDYTPALPQSPCPCCSGGTFADCCQPLLEGRDIARSAEQLMRSRYCAHATAQIQYIVDTWEASQRATLDVAAIRQWALSSTWLGLQILATEQGLPGDTDGRVEFVASFKNGDAPQLHRENSKFMAVDGRWYFFQEE